MCCSPPHPRGWAHTVGRSQGPVVRQWFLSLRRWLPVLQPVLNPRTLPEVACVTGRSGALRMTWPSLSCPRFLSAADSDPFTLTAPWHGHCVLGAHRAPSLLAGALSGQALPPVMGAHCSRHGLAL